MLSNDLQINERIYFIPYTTDKPQIRVGQIDSDNEGKFIKYAGGYCADNGEWYICRVKDINNTRVIHRLNAILNKVIKEQ